MNGRSYCTRSEEHTSELQARRHLVCRLLLEKKKAIRLYPGLEEGRHLAHSLRRQWPPPARPRPRPLLQPSLASPNLHLSVDDFFFLKKRGPPRPAPFPPPPPLQL